MSFNQKSLSGGGNRDASTPSFTNAPISRFIAYKKCCPPGCDPYIYLEKSFITVINIITNLPSFTITGWGINNNSIRPCYPNNLINNVKFELVASLSLPTIYYARIYLIVNNNFPNFNTVYIRSNNVFITLHKSVAVVSTLPNNDIQYLWIDSGPILTYLSPLETAEGGKYTLSFA